MRPRDLRKTLQQIRSVCGANGIDVEVIPEKGKGSHRGLLFEDRKTGKSVRIVISGDKEISPGVQRNALKYLRELAVRAAPAEVVRRILEAIFKS